jgi:hypothetical protein
MLTFAVLGLLKVISEDEGGILQFLSGFLNVLNPPPCSLKFKKVIVPRFY